MSNFDKYSNYHDGYPFTSVVFGANKPLLEVELNEMQQIINDKFKRLSKVLGAGFYSYSVTPFILVEDTISLTGGIVITSKGTIIHTPSLSVKWDKDNPHIYFRIEEIEVTKDSIIRRFGSVEEIIYPNPIQDSRMPIETTRRKAYSYTLEAGVKKNLIEDVNTSYVSVGTFVNSEFIPEKPFIPFNHNAVFTGSISMGRKEWTRVGENSVAIGNSIIARDENSFASGKNVTALRNQFAFGHYNDVNLAGHNTISGVSTGTVFVLGNGTASTPSNAFRVTGEGFTYAKGAYNATGADYAEYEEWADGNPNNEDRRGYFVTYDEEKPTMIRKAKSTDIDILGIVSGNPCIIGNSDEGWVKKNLFDEFNSPIYEEVEEEIERKDPETGEIKKEIITVKHHKINPEYDPTREYIHRGERPEWSAVGRVGKLSVRDDGTCVAGGYCTYSDGGIATKAEPSRLNYRVLERISENIIRIELKY